MINIRKSICFNLDDFKLNEKNVKDFLMSKKEEFSFNFIKLKIIFLIDNILFS